MIEWASRFCDSVGAVAGGAGVALFAALVLLALSRVTLPALRKRYWILALPLLANDWASGEQIEGWAHAQGNPQPGWIIAHPNARGSGHVGITDFDGIGVAAGSEFVSRCFKDWQDGTSVYRKKE